MLNIWFSIHQPHLCAIVVFISLLLCLRREWNQTNIVQTSKKHHAKDMQTACAKNSFYESNCWTQKVHSYVVLLTKLARSKQLAS